MNQQIGAVMVQYPTQKLLQMSHVPSDVGKAECQVQQSAIGRNGNQTYHQLRSVIITMEM